ncbi:hypothetical protein R9X47_07120 [Wukongibacter baidiensis]|uniref:spermine/spermidine synthase domain-containing protein n=1 Tax=Wukongibacter baidiensis TaxID=1723361 RepID=UPI003D7FE63F
MKKSTKKNYDIFMYLAVFLITFSLFSYEILLTRLFSVILSHNLVFLVVSFAILGSGLGGIAAYRQLKNKRNLDINKMIIRLSSLLALSIVATILLIYRMPYVPVYSLYALIGIIPFVIGGSIISIIFKEFIDASSKLYFMDLVGSALGSIAIIKVMNTYGFMYSVVITTLGAIGASIFIASYFREKKSTVLKSLIFVPIVGVLIQGSLVRDIEKGFSSYFSSPNTVISYLQDTNEKPLSISYSKWNAISRTDVIETTNENEKIVVTDGGASAPIIRFDGDLNKVDYLKKQVNFIPFAIGKNDKTLVIGSGGGKDVLLALLGESKDISAVEINSSTIEAVDEFKEFSGNIYRRPEVKTYNQDGRNFIENTKETYDNIYLSMVMTNAIENTMYSLSENYLFTEEAFEKYLKKLNENGKLSFMTHSALDMTKIVNTGIKVLMENGVSQEDITNHFVIVNGASENHRSVHGDMIRMPMIVFKNDPFTQDEIESLLDITSFQRRQLVHFPGGEYELFRQLRDNEISYNDMLETYSVNVKPINDNSPFFYNYTNLVPKEIILIGILALVIWSVVKRKYFIERKTNEISKYFIVIGMAYMLIEIPFVQKTVLYFGNPTIAFSSVLFSILVSSGIGSLISGHSFVKKHTSKSSIYLLLTTTSVITVLTVIDKITLLTNDFDLLYKVATIFFTLLPMGILMGMPFPTGISKIKEEIRRDDIVPLMWGANGIFSVIGSILAVSFSMKVGFNITIILGAMLYLYLYVRNPLKDF